MPTCNGTITTCDPTPNDPCGNCSTTCKEIYNSDCIIYGGVPLSNIDIVTGDTLNEVLAALDVSVDPCAIDVINANVQYNNGINCTSFIMKQDISNSFGQDIKNLIIGYNADLGIPLNASFCYSNVIVGIDAGNPNLAQVGITENVIIGTKAAYGARNASRNVLIGDNVSASLTNGYQNICIGWLTGPNITTGFGNVAIGANGSGSGNTTGSYNTALGWGVNHSGGGNTSYSIGIGTQADTVGSNMCVFGGKGSAGSNIADFYPGGGYEDTTPTNVTIHATGAALVNDLYGADLKLQAGIPTGTAKSGDLVVLSSMRSTVSSSNTATTIEAYRHRGSAINTTTATTTVIDSYITPSNKTTTFNVRIVAKGTTTNSAFYNFVATFNNNGGSVTQIGATTKLVEQESVGGWDMDFNINGTSVETRVISTAMNISWIMSAEIFTV